MINQALYTSNSGEWRTPPTLFASLDGEYKFALDAAATPENALCKSYYTIQDNALYRPWRCYGRVYCNPPYGRSVGAWVKKAHKEGCPGCIVVMLLPARTDTAWFHDYVYGEGGASKIIFLRGRVKFLSPDGTTRHPAPFPSMVVVWGEE